MTTTVLIGTHGHKEVEIMTSNGGCLVLPPGQWVTLQIHGEQALNIKETGDFVNSPPGARYEATPGTGSQSA